MQLIQALSLLETRAELLANHRKLRNHVGRATTWRELRILLFYFEEEMTETARVCTTQNRSIIWHFLGKNLLGSTTWTGNMSRSTNNVLEAKSSSLVLINSCFSFLNLGQCCSRHCKFGWKKKCVHILPT